ncbi:hypothetical protein JI664_10735 [Rhodobacter sp. NTK016B]|uniref:hypothetical protein n=1 Tax=Rhodobacter sp. NTK016B TaxID=2759676 RepID=UPI001A8FE7A1|nr:hypothetical protein [Rhodobacter sp. NTK016B]MBN8292442.1 hypothetical protein [Rhodobacter sp. NTK016B]
MLDGASSVIVFFSNFKEADWQAVASREDNIRFRGHSAVFVFSKYNHWWQIPELDEMCACIRAATEGYAQRIAYGSSKGGFGALLLGADIDSTRIVAIAPQTTISDPAIPLRSVWKEEIAKRPILRDNVADSLKILPEVLYDPYKETDLPHVNHLKARAEIEELRFPHGGHKLLKTFKECGILGDVMGRLFREKTSESELLEIFDPVKRRSSSYMLNLVQWLALTGAYAQATLEFEALEALDPSSVASFREGAAVRLQTRDDLAPTLVAWLEGVVMHRQTKV